MIAFPALRRRMAATASTAAIVAALSAGPALAQGAAAAEQPTQGANTVGEVVVTAQFRAQNVQQTPIAITAVNAAMLEQRGQTSIDQVANQAPNVSLRATGAAFGPSLAASIRGVGQYDFNPALEPGVGLYVDDVYYSTLTGSILDLLDLDRVEILRGPQGTLAGKNSIGGAVKLYSKRPTGSGNGYVDVAYGGLNRLEARGGIDFALVPDKLFARISAVTKNYDGYVDRIDYACSHPGSGLPSLASSQSCKLGEEGGKSYAAVRANVRWLINDEIEFNLIGDYTHDHSDNAATTLLYANNTNPFISLNGVPYDRRFISSNPYVSYAGFTMPAGSIAAPPVRADALSAEDKSRYQGWGVSGTLDWKLTDNLSLKSITAGRGYTSSFAEDNDVSPLPLGLGVENLRHHQFSEEVRLNGSLLDNKLDYTVGGFYFWQRTVYATHQDLWYPGIILDFLGNDPVLAHTKAGFVHGVYHLTDKLSLTAGVRYTSEDKDYTFVRVNRDGSPNIILGALNGVTGHYEGSHWDYRANIAYQWTPDVMTYAQFSTGFKGGGINPRPFVAPQVRPFGAETLDAYEIGFKSSWLERRVRLNGSAFYNKYKDIQLTMLSCPQFGGPGPCALPSNAGDATVKGFELETELRPARGLEIDGSLSYLDFEYTRIDPSVGGPSSSRGVQFGMVTPFTSKWKASVGIQYEIPLGGLGSVTPRFDASYQGALYTNAVNGPLNRIAPYTLMNARLTWRPNSGGWEAALEVSNLGDKLYYLGKFDLTGAGAGSVAGLPAMPREWLVRVKKTF